MTDTDLENTDGPRPYAPPVLNSLEQQIFEEWGDQGSPNIEAIQEIAGDMLRLAMMDIGEPPHQRSIAPDEDELIAKLFEMIEKIARENSALDPVFKIRDFIEDNVRFKEPIEDD